METTIIECSKRDSISNGNSNRWTNSLKEGKIVSKGDFISVEGISINSVGVGGDVIEIPNEIYPKQGTLYNNINDPLNSLNPNENYEPNSQSIVCGVYYNHNYKDTCSMPFSNFVSGYVPTPQIQGCEIDSTPSDGAGINSNPNYGYITKDPFPLGQIEHITTYPSNINSQPRNNTRYYGVVPYINPNDDGEKPDWNSPNAPSVYNPVDFVEWKLLTTELRFTVNKGYDSPENISSVINEQINMAVVSSSQYIPLGNESHFVANDDLNLSQLSTTKNSIYTIPVNGKLLGPQGNYFYQNNFFLYPQYTCAGYNLISPITQKVQIQDRLGGAGFRVSSQGEILSLNDLPVSLAPAPPLLNFPEGQLLVSNLIFNAKNCERIRKYYWSQGGYSGGLFIDANAPISIEEDNINNETLLSHPEYFNRYIDMGRFDDSHPLVPAAAPLQPFTQTGVGNGFLVTGDNVSNELEVSVSYTDERWDSAITPPVMALVGGGNPAMLLTYEKIEEFVDVATGETIMARSMAKAYNINIVCIKTTSPNGFITDPVIAFVLKACNPLLTPKEPLDYSSYILYDPAFSRLANACIKPMGWKRKADAVFGPEVVAVPPTADPLTFVNTAYESSLQVGAPNPTFAFNEGRGRFQFSQLHWGHRIGSKESKIGVASASEVVIEMNVKAERFGGFHNQLATNPMADRVYPITEAGGQVFPIQTFVNSDSGIGFLYYGMKIAGSSSKWEYLKDDLDINLTTNLDDLNYKNVRREPKKYFKGSLLDRLGWDYTDLFPDYGKARNLYLTNTYNQPPKMLFYNPLPSENFLETYKMNFNSGVRPLTTNPNVDSVNSLGYSVNNYGQPMFDVHLQRGAGNDIAPIPLPAPNPDALVLVPINGINITAESAIVGASRLPKKLEFPYWLVYSDIIGNVKFLGKDGQPNNVMAIANRAYTSGDYAFNFATDYTFQATTDFVLTEITTEILNPDYSKSIVDEGTIILYKIQHPNAPPPQETSRTQRV